MPGMGAYLAVTWEHHDNRWIVPSQRQRQCHRPPHPFHDACTTVPCQSLRHARPECKCSTFFAPARYRQVHDACRTGDSCPDLCR